MSSFSFHSDRIHGPAPRVKESVPDETLQGLESLVRRRIDNHWLAGEFGDQCPDGYGVAGTDHRALGDEINALIPGIDWPGWATSRDQDTVFDLVEYVAAHIAYPSQGHFHDYFRHHELSFDQAEGQRRFREDVNRLFARAGTVFELAPSLRIERRGAPETQHALDDLRPSTGDATLDNLIEAGRRGYLSRRPEERETAVEKLWDAFERLKTIDDPADKKRSVTVLLSHIADRAWREVIEAEMRSMTSLGNSFRIRHSEVGKHEVPTKALDYVTARMANLLVQLLGASGRLSQ
ncbi:MULTISPECIES: hypothetical protein [unclassified Nocardioides]|uniref:hypothetical protein n=1 Tax=unclassified Nocardioides TaxID=2615069 RepID=UPI0000570040|nr:MULTISPECIES: hypothetical protein [unclassified Nocardioides]ABL79365.1 conserved hypothetical protein [Nocardioides sp. JS614]